MEDQSRTGVDSRLKSCKLSARPLVLRKLVFAFRHTTISRIHGTVARMIIGRIFARESQLCHLQSALHTFICEFCSLI
jgi:hypothetical protein